MGVDVDGLACPLHHLMVCGYQMRGKSFQSDATLSRHAEVGGGTFSGGVKPTGLDIFHGVDHPGTYKTESYVEKPAFTEGMLTQCQSYHGDYVCTLD
jgi:hypothetical protein